MVNIEPIIIDFHSILGSFIETKKIKTEISDNFLIENSEKLKELQINILKKQLKIESQRTLFNAIETIIEVFDKMKTALDEAFKRNENPTTAEKCIELVPLMQDLGNEIDAFNKSLDSRILENIVSYNRFLIKNASKNNFLKTDEEKMLDIKLDRKQIEEFVENINQNIESSLEETN